jgi:hypothetical protein
MRVKGLGHTEKKGISHRLSELINLIDNLNSAV